MVLRLADRRDAASIAQIHLVSYRTTYRGLVPEHWLASLSYQERKARWEQRLSSPEEQEFAYVAEEEAHRIVGFASGGTPAHPEDRDYHGELRTLHVLPQFHHQGLGRRLTCAVIDHLAQQKKWSLIVWVVSGNPACGFYEHLGGQLVREQLQPVGDALVGMAAYGWADTRLIPC